MSAPLRSTHLFGSILCAAGVLGVAAPASAQEVSSSTALEARTGGTFGVALGAGHIGCTNADGDDCDGDGANEAGGIAVHAGWMVTPRLALIGKAWGMTHREDRLTINQGIVAAAARGWLLPRLWLEGGVGVARSTAEYDLGSGIDLMSESDTVPALIAGVGVEVLRGDRYALDLELQGGSGLYESDIRVYNVAIGAGLSFY